MIKIEMRESNKSDKGVIEAVRSLWSVRCILSLFSTSNIIATCARTSIILSFPLIKAKSGSA